MNDRTSSLKPCLGLDIIILLNRLSLGGYFAITGSMKVFRMGMTGWLAFFDKTAPPWLPGWFATIYGHALPFVEISVGVLLIVGLFSRAVASLMGLILLSIMIGATGVWNTKADLLHPNVVFFTLALLLAAVGAGRLSLDRLIFAKHDELAAV